MNFDWDKHQSTVIDVLRLPLAICVIFAHLKTKTFCPMESEVAIMSLRGIYNIAKIVTCSFLGKIAVSTFFLFSGYLFFSGFSSWSWSLYKKKITSRCKTLVIPYFLWNALAFLLPLAPIIASVLFKNGDSKVIGDYLTSGSWHIFVDYSLDGYCAYPIDIPLWFLRDLIVVTFLSPVIYLISGYFKVYGTIALLLANLTGIWFSIPGFSITAFFFFSLGAFFSLHGINMVRVAFKYLKYLLPVSVVLSVISVAYYGTANDCFLLSLSGQMRKITSVFSILGIASYIVRKTDIRACPILTKSTFFIYASHTVGIFLYYTPMTLSEKLLYEVIPGNSIFYNGVAYFFSPVLTTIICIIVYWLLLKVFPRLSAPFRGYR